MTHKIDGLKVLILNQPDKGDPLNTKMQLAIIAFVDGERKYWSAITEQYMLANDTVVLAAERCITAILPKILSDFGVIPVLFKED